MIEQMSQLNRCSNLELANLSALRTVGNLTVASQFPWKLPLEVRAVSD
jgi:hypothetical protein